MARVIYEEQDKKYVFSNRKFKIYYDEQKRNACEPVGLKKRLGNATNSSEHTVKDWAQGKTGPSDIDKVKAIADVFKMGDFRDLLELQEGENVNMGNQEKNSEVVIEIYDLIVEFIEEFRRTKGYRFSFIYTNRYMLWYGDGDEGYYVSSTCDSVGAVRFAEYSLGVNPASQKYNELVVAVRKARKELSKEIVESILGLIADVYNHEEYFEEFSKYLEYEDEEKRVTKCSVDETEYLAYISSKTVEYYERLEEILKEYLP